MAEQIMTDLLTVKEMASLLQIHPNTIYQWVEKTEVPFIRLGNGKKSGIRFRKNDIDEWLEKRTSKAKAIPFSFDIQQSKEESHGFLLKGGHALRKKSKGWLSLGDGGGVLWRTTKGGIRRFDIKYRDEDGRWKQEVVRNAQSLEEAVRICIQKKEEILCRKHGLKRKPKRIKFNEFADMYLEDYAMVQKVSWKADRSYLKSMKEYFGNLYLDEIGSLRIGTFKKWKLGKGVQKSTVNRCLAILRKMMNKAVEWDFLIESEKPKFEMFREDENQRDRVLAEEEESRFFNSIAPEAPHLGPIVMVALHTGIRKSRVLNLRWNQIDFEKREIRVEKTKNGRIRYIPLNHKLMDLFLRLRKDRRSKEYVFINPETGRPITDVSRSFDTTCRRAGIENLRFHDLRHTFGTRLKNEGADIKTIMELMGHRSIKMTERYMHSSQEQKRRAVESLAKNSNRLNINGMAREENEGKSVIPLFSIN